MKAILTLLITAAVSFPALAQNSWQVVHNGQEKLSATAEQPSGHVLTLSKGELARTGNLVVRYKEPARDGGWKRWIAFFDSQDTELYKVGASQAALPNARLAALLKKAPVIKVYTWALPTDPELAARIRIRRVHLCTLKLRG